MSLNALNSVEGTFEFLGSHYIPALKLTLERYQHKTTGAFHYHLANDDQHQVFMVALRTLPQDDTGVAHILEHTVLCGSQKYPVRDPFFMMIRRSLNTFMNAFTASDWTAYPFASQNDKDFDNLLSVYLDAVFFPTLDELDFKQEGHRLEFDKLDDAASGLKFKGVVFNEMKGAMSSDTSQLYQKLTYHLFPTATYHYNSGGEPEAIPDLSYQQLKDFHAQHYHPSNAVFITYGKRSAASLQTIFEQEVLSRFPQALPRLSVTNEISFTMPKRVVEEYALDEEDTSEKTHIVMAWKLGENKDIRDVLRAQLMNAVLLDNSASPMLRVLETSELGKAPSPMTGLEEEIKEMMFALGLQGSEPERTEQVEALILSELQRIVDEGVDAQQVEAMLHQLEMSQREIGGGAYPYGLQLALGILPAALHGGDPNAALDLDSVLEELREEISNESFIPHLVQSLLLDNPHRVTLTLKPSTSLSAEKLQRENARLANIENQLTAEQKQSIVDQALALKARQEQQDDPEILPKVTLADVPANIKSLQGVDHDVAGLRIKSYQQGTNGLVYQRMVLDMPSLLPEKQALLPIFNACLTEVGSGGRDYLQTQVAQASISGGISARSSIAAHPHSLQGSINHYILGGKALNRNHGALSDLMLQTLETVKFDEYNRIIELVQQGAMGAKRSIVGSGHGYAMGAAEQNLSALAQWQFERSGLAGVKTFLDLSKSLSKGDAVEGVAEKLRLILHKLQSAAKEAMVVHDDQLANAAVDLGSYWHRFAQEDGPVSQFVLEEVKNPAPIHQAWLTNAEVNYCAMSFATVPMTHADAPKLAVLSAILRNGYLHRAIREQGGAYGGGAKFDASTGAFSFYSYRDPRLMDTFNDFTQAQAWLATEAKAEQVEEAILNIVSTLDKPSSPAGEAKAAYARYLRGVTDEMRMEYRQGVLTTQLDELRAVAAKYLIPETANRAVVAGPKVEKVLVAEGFDIFNI